MEIDKKTVIFDFDGILCIPGSRNYYPYTPYLLDRLYKEGCNICLATFNFDAELIIYEWGLRKYFNEIRAGSNTNIKGIYQNNNVYRSYQIQDIIKSLELVNDIFIYDCNINVLQEVYSHLFYDYNKHLFIVNNHNDFLYDIHDYVCSL